VVTPDPFSQLSMSMSLWRVIAAVASEPKMMIRSGLLTLRIRPTVSRTNDPSILISAVLRQSGTARVDLPVHLCPDRKAYLARSPVSAAVERPKLCDPQIRLQQLPFAFAEIKRLSLTG